MNNDSSFSFEDKEFINLISKDIEHFKSIENKNRLLLFPALTSYHRLIIHKFVGQFCPCLSTFSVGKSYNRRIIICGKSLKQQYFALSSKIQNDMMGDFSSQISEKEKIKSSKKKHPDIQIYIPRAKRILSKEKSEMTEEDGAPDNWEDLLDDSSPSVSEKVAEQTNVLSVDLDCPEVTNIVVKDDLTESEQDITSSSDSKSQNAKKPKVYKGLVQSSQRGKYLLDAFLDDPEYTVTVLDDSVKKLKKHKTSSDSNQSRKNNENNKLGDLKSEHLTNIKSVSPSHQSLSSSKNPIFTNSVVTIDSFNISKFANGKIAEPPVFDNDSSHDIVKEKPRKKAQKPKPKNPQPDTINSKSTEKTKSKSPKDTSIKNIKNTSTILISPCDTPSAPSEIINAPCVNDSPISIALTDCNNETSLDSTESQVHSISSEKLATEEISIENDTKVQNSSSNSIKRISNGYHTKTDTEGGVDSWDSLFTEAGDVVEDDVMEEITKTVGGIQIDKPLLNYAKYQPKEIELDYKDYAHLIEIYEFPDTFQTRDILPLFKDFMQRGFDIKWVDETHAIGIFSSYITAQEALSMKHPIFKVRPLSEASKQTKLKARKCVEFLEPYKARPETTASVARNMVTQALGVKSQVPKEKRDEERKKLKEAKEKRRLTNQQKTDAWEGNMTNNA